MKQLASLLSVLLAGCSTVPSTSQSPAQHFFDSFTALCGKSYAGKLVAGDSSDSAFAEARMLAHFRKCSDTEISIAFDVGEDRSRTWIITKVGEGLRLKHRHMLKDGTEDPVSRYGGDTSAPGLATRQAFPADDFSKQMFIREGREVSTTNVWAFEIKPGATFTYELARPSRLFRVEFDSSKAIAAGKSD